MVSQNNKYLNHPLINKVKIDFAQLRAVIISRKFRTSFLVTSVQKKKSQNQSEMNGIEICYYCKIQWPPEHGGIMVFRAAVTFCFMQPQPQTSMLGIENYFPFQSVYTKKIQQLNEGENAKQRR